MLLGIYWRVGIKVLENDYHKKMSEFVSKPQSNSVEVRNLFRLVFKNRVDRIR